ncbi:hydroxyethylthiazole kinase [Streptococcus pneumoniae]|nr:hydroxyethylthiazole kinase [Streptococcus pneumoniae]
MTSLKLLKEKAPLVICITNDVVKNFTANGLVALNIGDSKRVGS